MMTKKAKRRMMIVACIDFILKLIIGVSILFAMIYVAAKYSNLATPIARQWLWKLHYALMSVLG